MPSLIGLLSTWAGIATFALAQDKHHRRLLRHAPTTGRCGLCRGLGLLALTAGWATKTAREGTMIGGIVWLGWCGLGILAIIVVLALLPAKKSISGE